MVFSSLLFLFAFLTPQLIIYYLCRKTTARNIVLLCFSMIFYAWGGPKYLLILLSEALISWYTAREIGKCTFKQVKKAWMILGCVLLLLLLVIFKYTGFLLTNVQKLTGWPSSVPSIVLPIGISFYTFQLLSYIVDVYRGEVEPQRAYWKVLLYASLFHQCIAGPIVRYQTVADEIENRNVGIRDFSDGIRRFAVGLAKKAILANGCAAIADKLLPLTADALKGAATSNLYLGVFCYMLQIYLDFSAYSDMAIGMGRMVGFHYLENFDYPYMASSVQNFWRRWHISLSTFFRDYIYIPLGGSRKGAARTYLNLFIVWGLTGMWHGASWNYLLWGLYFFVFLAIERLFLGKVLEKIPKIFGHIYALIVVFFGWVLFKFNDTAALMEAFRGLFGVDHPLTSPETLSMLGQQAFFLVFAVIAVFPVGKKLREWIRKTGKSQNRFFTLGFSYGFDAVIPIVLIVLSVLALVGNSYNPFLYFQF